MKIEEHLTQYNSKNTKEMYKVHLNQYFKIIDADPDIYFNNGRDYEADIRRYARAISDKSPKTQKSKIACIRTFLIDHDVEIRERIWRGINRRRNGNGVITIDKVPDPADLKKILHYGTSKARALYLILASSGMRISETIGITWNDINFSNNTSEMKTSYLSESSFKNYGGLVTTKENLQNLDGEELGIINKVKKEMKETSQTNLLDETYVQARIIDDLETEEYKSPLDVTLLSHRPEREFIKMLIRNYSQHIDAWIKSKDKGFYSVPYIHRPGTHSLQKDFNPDFFIRKGDKIIVVEIKSEDDSTINLREQKLILIH